MSLILIIAGIGFIQLTSAYSLPFLLVGMLVEAAGWSVVPTTVARRVAVIVPALGISALLLSGPAFAGFFAVPLGCWLLVRFRPALSWTVLILPIASAILLSPFLVYYNQSWVSLLISTVVSVAAAWIARALARWTGIRRGNAAETSSTS